MATPANARTAPFPAQVGVVWLYRWCERMVGPGDEAMSAATAVASVLLAAGGTAGGTTGDEVAGQLFDLLGDAAFEGLHELMENR